MFYKPSKFVVMLFAQTRTWKRTWYIYRNHRFWMGLGDQTSISEILFYHVFIEALFGFQLSTGGSEMIFITFTRRK
jgi:hypothetical protein